jgi:AcrR family transcriptional regulator
MARTQTLPRREQLLAIAGQLFAEYGYHGCSIRQIAAAAGLQSATLYGHFDSKAAIFKELIRRYFDDQQGELAAIATGDSRGSAKLEAMIRRSIAIGRRHRNGFIALSNNWKHIQVTPELAELVEGRNALHALWLGVIEGGLADGSLKPGIAPRDLLWVIYAAVTGLVDDRYQVVEGSPAEPPVDLLLTMMAGGLWRRKED